MATPNKGDKESKHAIDCKNENKPMKAASNASKLNPRHPVPNRGSAKPHLARLLINSKGSGFKKSGTSKLGPVRVVSKGENAKSRQPEALENKVRPKRLKERANKVESIPVQSSTNSRDSGLPTENKRNARSDLAGLCGDESESDVAQSKTNELNSSRAVWKIGKADPRNMLLRINIKLPNHIMSTIKTMRSGRKGLWAKSDESVDTASKANTIRPGQLRPNKRKTKPKHASCFENAVNPHWTKSTISEDDPYQPIPYKDRADPSRLYDVTNSELPKRACSSMLIAKARRATPATEMCSPNLAWHRANMKKSKSAKSNINSDEPNLIKRQIEAANPDLATL